MARVRGALGLVVLAGFVVGGAACTFLDDVSQGREDGADAAPTTTETTTPPMPTGTGTGTGAPDAAPPIDASADGGDVDAGADAEVDGGGTDGASDAAPDSAPDAAADAVMEGADGVLRGFVSGARFQDWAAKIRLPNATCPAGARTISAGSISCCVFEGALQGNVGRIPVVFDPATRSGTLAGAPFGPLSAPVTDPDGTMRFQMAAFLEGARAWQVGIEIARASGAPAGEIAEMVRLYENPALVRALGDSLKYMVLTWHPTTKAFRVRFDTTTYQATAAGTCGIPGLQDSIARLQFDLR